MCGLENRTENLNRKANRHEIHRKLYSWPHVQYRENRIQYYQTSVIELIIEFQWICRCYKLTSKHRKLLVAVFSITLWNDKLGLINLLAAKRWESAASVPANHFFYRSSLEKLCLIKLAVNLSDVVSFSFRNEKDVLKNDKANHILLSVRICVWHQWKAVTLCH